MIPLPVSIKSGQNNARQNKTLNATKDRPNSQYQLRFAQAGGLTRIKKSEPINRRIRFAVCKWTDKPSSVPAKAGATIYLDRPLPADSASRQATYPPAELTLVPGLGHADILGLAGGGVCRPMPSPTPAVRSYRTISTLPVPLRAIGGILSVALSLGLPPVVIIHHRALPCSDFPLAAKTTSGRMVHFQNLYANKIIVFRKNTDKLVLTTAYEFGSEDSASTFRAAHTAAKGPQTGNNISIGNISPPLATPVAAPMLIPMPGRNQNSPILNG